MVVNSCVVERCVAVLQGQSVGMAEEGKEGYCRDNKRAILIDNR